ncbi:hypothetical protein Ddye_023204 [Dipteronia dyeriana]|uniref:Glycosyltransferase n=1 Tax=Dipteronia dyeriana TaxID=168575 RepID=A0AAD9TSN3_9ROSI|nr:hypothetical protein Ddye_023204 [Dipteronia dyeriana]
MKKAELIFVPLPSIGHLVSTLEFAKRLIDRDDRILIVVLVMKLPLFPHVDAYTKSVAAAQPRIRLIELPQVDSPPPQLRKSCIEYFNYLLVESQVANVRHVVSQIVLSRSNSDSVRVTGLVVDMFCVFFSDIATELGLPSYVYFAPNTGTLSLLMDIATHQEEFEESSESELLIAGIVNPVPVSVLPQSLFTKHKESYSTYIKRAQKFKNVNGILVNTFFELEQYAVKSFSGGLNPPVYTIGPVLDLQGQPNPNLDEEQCRKIFKWLDDQPESSVVLLCFGSGGSFGPAQVKEMAIGLEQSEHKFLWSLRLSPPNNEVAGNEDGDIFPEGFLERIRGRGMICGWDPQVEFLAHKAIGGFVSHCGWNSILESLWYGVPIVTWPLYAEQQLNAFRMVKELGLAVELRLDSRSDIGDLVTADEIARAVGCVMDGDSEIRKKVKKMAEISRKSLMDGGSSFVSIGQFIDLNFK